MKSIVFEIKNPADGDLVVIEARAPRGGKNNAKHLVRGPRKSPTLDNDGFVTSITDVPGDTPADVAAGLAACINAECVAECARAEVQPDTGALIVRCTDLFSDIAWTMQVQGNGGTTITKQEF